MRFSSVFHLPGFQRSAASSEARVEVKPVPDSSPAPLSVSTCDLPDDLDQRVRLIGEWQLGEGD